MEQGDAAAVASISGVERGRAGDRGWNERAGLASGGLRQGGSHFIVARTSTNAWSNELTRMSPRRGYSRSMMT